MVEGPVVPILRRRVFRLAEELGDERGGPGTLIQDMSVAEEADLNDLP